MVLAFAFVLCFAAGAGLGFLVTVLMVASKDDDGEME